MNKKNIFICCTEQSGENICYNILKRINLSNINVDGVCGARSEKYFSNKFYDISDFKSIGLIEILLSLWKYIKMINFLKSSILKKNYDLVICIDSPDFNYQLTKSLRKSKFSNKIIQIVAPTVWAWRANRAKKFAKYYDEIFVLFDFEKKYFNFPNINCLFIGHPIFHIKRRSTKKNYKYIAFLLGSRENEINKLFEYFDSLENYIYSNKIKYEIFIPTLPHLLNLVKKRTKKWKIKTYISSDIENFDEIYENVFLSITCSGTATLEIAKRNIPQIVVYKLNYLTELIMSYFVKVKNACLLNIVSNKMIVPEILNSNLTSKKLIESFDSLLNDSNLHKEQISSVNYFLPKFISNESPYDISVRRILSII